MKLRDCVLMGLFCGLNTIGESIANYDMHYLQCIPYTEATADIAELAADLKAYEAGDLVLDWDELRALNDKALKEYEDHCKAEIALNPLKRHEEIDFGF
jgi:hypothetical protein